MAVSPLDSMGREPVTKAVSGPPVPAGDLDPAAAARSRRRWWQEILMIAAFYGLYSAVRDLRGSRPVSVSQAFRNARRVIGFERTLGVYHEPQLQHAFLGYRTFVRLLDDWYGSTHFVVTAAVLALLYFAYPHRYRFWRNTLGVATALALVGFACFPLMPPRLLPPGYGFTDTLRTVGGLWNFDSGPISRLSDQYAAMPSLHFAWALWCGAAIAAVSRHRWQRVLAWCYPAVTLLCVLVTANHYFSDAAAGGAIVALGAVAATAYERRFHREPQPVPGPARPSAWWAGKGRR